MIKIWKKFLEVVRVSAVRMYVITYLRTALTSFSIQVFSSHDDKERNRKRGGHCKTAAKKSSCFFFFFLLQYKLMSKDLMLHISEFRFQKYADIGGSPLSLKIYIVCTFIFDWLNVRK